MELSSRRRLDSCILRSGPWYVRLRARTPRLGEVLGSNLFRVGDWVELPPGAVWTEARVSDRRGDTRISPLELAQAYDGASETWALDPRPAASPPFPAESDEETELLAREVSAMLAEEKVVATALNVRTGPWRSVDCA